MLFNLQARSTVHVDNVRCVLHCIAIQHRARTLGHDAATAFQTAYQRGTSGFGYIQVNSDLYNTQLSQLGRQLLKLAPSWDF